MLDEQEIVMRADATTHFDRRFRRGFTLVELLIVMFLISLLLLILLPSLSRAMRQATNTVCMHNLKELYHALQVYRLDSGGWVPTTDPSGPDTPPDAIASWYEKLSPKYLNDPKLLRCPADPYQPAPGEYVEVASSSYGLSDFIQSSPDAYLANLDRRKPKRPLDTLLLADVGPDVVGGAFPMHPGRWAAHRVAGTLPWDDSFEAGANDLPPSWLTARHSGGVNMITMGGIARRVPTRELMGDVIADYYPADAAGECPLCLQLRVPHYSFAHAQTFWWTGPIPEP